MGYVEYDPIAAQYGTPIVVTGFEPLDLLQGIKAAVVQLEEGRAEVENAYQRAVNRTGNIPAQEMVNDVFTTIDRNWRGIGMIPESGWALAEEYRAFDAAERFTVTDIDTVESPLCHAGEVLRGTLKPDECPAFGKECTPRTPLGATMVSAEGACAAYYLYGRFQELETAP
jgi:hydrogenase expression/formation protein HypD